MLRTVSQERVEIDVYPPLLCHRTLVVSLPVYFESVKLAKLPATQEKYQGFLSRGIAPKPQAGSEANGT